MAVRIQMRRGTTTQWNTADPVLNEGEIGYNTTLASFKIGDGSTVWSELDYYQTAASITPSEVGAIALTEKGAANGVAELDASKNLLVPGASIIIEGATPDAYETTLTVTDPTADRTITFPDSSGTVALTSTLSGYAALAGATFTGAVTGTDLTLSGNLTVNGTTTTIDTTNLNVEDKNITLAYGNTSDVNADGGGITLLGTTNKTFNWVDATDSWTSSEHINLASGKSYYVNGTLLKDVSETLTNKTISAGTLTGTLTAGGGVGSTGQYLESTGTGVRWTTVSGYSAPTLGSTSIASGATVTNVNGLTINSTTVPTSATLLVSGGALGTPSSATLTNATGLPVSGITASTTSALGVGSIELGHASDTTIARSSAGVISVEGVVVPTISSSDTLSNKTLASAVATTAFTLNATAEIRFADTDSSNYVGFKSPGVVSANKIWTLPSADGTNGQTLSTNGSGTLSWTTPAAGAAFSEMLLIGA